MKDLILIDGNSLLFRAYFAMHPMVNSKGLHTQAVFAFVNMLNKIIRDYSPQYIAVAFDMKGGTFRHEKYKDYKAGRQQTPPELLSQIPIMHRVLEAMNIAVLEKEKYEADDIIGTVSKRSGEKGLDTLIISGDKDELQLIDEHVNVLINKKGMSEFDVYDIDKMNERYGLTPSQFIDLKGLMGDSSDNIPGIAGIGEKKGIALLKEYGSLDNVIEHADEIKGKMGENVRAGIESARLSKWLATINTESPIEFKWDGLKYIEPDKAKLIEIYKELEFSKFIKQLGDEGAFDVSDNSSNDKSTDGDVFTDKFEDIRILSYEDFAADTPNGCEVYIEIASDNSHLDMPIVSAIALYNPETNSAYVKDTDITGLNHILSDIASHGYKLSGCGVQKVIYAIMNTAGDRIDVRPCFDVIVAEYLLDPNRQKYSMEKLMLRYLSLALATDDEYLSDKVNTESHAISKEQCLRRAYYSHEISKKQHALLVENNLLRLFEECEMPLVSTLAGMEICGIKCLPDVLADIGNELEGRIKELESSIYDEAGKEFNINSPKQLGIVLFEDLEIPYPKPSKSKSGSYSTAADILEKLSDNYRIVEEVLEYRKLSKLSSTYVEGLKPLIASDGRVHPHFMQTVAATGRLSCTEPNLQNIPIRDEYGRLIRKAFVVSYDNNVFTGSDYSQIELRILASLSGDESLINDFKEGKDIHRATASRVFDIPEEEVSSLDRTKAKAVNFGVVYGMSGFGLGESLHISRAEGQKYISDYFAKHSAVKKYLDDQVSMGEEKREVRTYYGRQRQIPEFASRKYMDRELAKRLAMNTPIQGTAADIIKFAMNSVSEELRKKNLSSRLILQIHDELIVEGPESESDEVISILDECMKNASDLTVDLVCDIHSGKTWYDLK